MAGRLTRHACAAALVAAVACGTSQLGETVPPDPTPLPTAGLAGRPVALYPLSLVVADRRLAWEAALGSREAALRTADSLLAAFFTERVPEINWVLPDALRRAARRAPGLLPDPDQIGTAVLRASNLTRVPDPLRNQLRNLTGVAGDRWAAVPAQLVFVPGDAAVGRAELTMVLVDVRNGLVGFRTVARGEASEPWAALWEALRTLAPDLP